MHAEFEGLNLYVNGQMMLAEATVSSWAKVMPVQIKDKWKESANMRVNVLMWFCARSQNSFLSTCHLAGLYSQ